MRKLTQSPLTPTVEVTLQGTGASGNKTLTVNSNVLTLARQFGAVKFFVGFQHNASFFVDDIVVTKKN